MNAQNMKRRALVSVSDKTGLEEFVRRLAEYGFEIISTGGTARALSGAGLAVTPVSKVTGAKEILGGRVKTLHPAIHGGILADLRDPDHVTQLVEEKIGPIDLVCVNLYPFEKTVASGADTQEAIENIDIGGPAMMRAAAKNHASVIVVPGPEFYGEVLSEMEGGEITEATRRRLALAAFQRTAEYDSAISGWLAGLVEDTGVDGSDGVFPERLTKSYRRAQILRYGENPHQEGAYYAEEGAEHLLAGAGRLQGRELSFNNLYDVDAARTILADIMEGGDDAGAVIIKHANPCGAAVGSNIAEAYRKALESDPVSAFGGIVALTGEVNGELAQEISKVFTEVLISPGFTDEAREVFSAKPNMILLQAGSIARPQLSAKYVTGAMLLQTTDRIEDGSEYTVSTEREPFAEERMDLLFAWRVMRGVKSNAIVLAKDGSTVGIGAGQMSRVESAQIAVKAAGERARGAVAASDAFFPFADGLEVLARAGVKAVIQPGGSKRDSEVVEAADRHEVAMVFTGRRHFLH